MRRECASCGAPIRGGQPDPLARCEFCGALLAVAAASAATPLEATPRIDAQAAWRRLLGTLRGPARAWRRHGAELVWFPFARGDDPARPLVPLAVLPPLLARSWRASGADLVDAEERPRAGERRVEPSQGRPADRPIIYYPFHRLLLRRGREISAAWCDAIDGQLLLPDDLRAPEAGEDPRLERFWRGALAAGAAFGLLLPAGPGLLLALATAAGLALRAGRMR